MLAQSALVTLFNGIGIATQHEHWFKEAEDVEPIVGPLCRIVETLPASTLKAFEKRFNTVALVGGIAFVAVPDITAEIKIRRAEAALKNEERARAQHPARPINAPGAAPGGGSRVPGPSPQPTANGRSGAAPEWRDTLPPPGLAVDY